MVSIPTPIANVVGQSVPDCGRDGGIGVAVGAVAQTQVAELVQDVFLQLPVVAPAAIEQIRLLGQSLFLVQVALQFGTGDGVGVNVGVGVAVAQTQLDWLVQDVFLQLPVVAPDAMKQIKLLGQSLFCVQVALQFGTGDGVGVNVGVGVAVVVGVAVGVGVADSDAVGVGVRVGPAARVKVKLHVCTVVFISWACGRLAGAFGATDWFLN